MRIVLDTNVVLSALLWRGTRYRLLDAIRQRSNTQLYSSAALLEELADVLTRPSATKRLALIDKTGATVLADYVEVIDLVAPTTVPRVVPGDIDDDHVIAAAVAGQADLIVSGDRKHLLPLGSHAGIASKVRVVALIQTAAASLSCLASTTAQNDNDAAIPDPHPWTKMVQSVSRWLSCLTPQIRSVPSAPSVLDELSAILLPSFVDGQTSQLWRSTAMKLALGID